MATESIKYVAPDTENKVKTQVFPRPGQHTTGLVDWLTTIDHKKDRFNVRSYRSLFSDYWWH